MNFRSFRRPWWCGRARLGVSSEQCRGTRHAGALACGHRHRAAADSRNPRPDLAPVRREPGPGFSPGGTLEGLSRRGCTRHLVLLARPIIACTTSQSGWSHCLAHRWFGSGSKASRGRWRRCRDCPGWEAGGHVRGTVATMPLVPNVVDAVSPVPVVAAGGIADGRGLAAALALGAAGAWIGTRFLASHEATIHTRYRERLLQASENDTIYLENLFDIRWPNAPHRTLRNQTVEAWEAAGRPTTGKRPGEGEVIATSRIGPIVRYQAYTPDRDSQGDIDALSLWAGQSVGLVSQVQSAGDIVREIADEARSILRRLAE
nr:nitronate monooxygenase [Bradyrhizobium sp. WSM1743]